MKTIKDLSKAIRDYSEIPSNSPTANRMFKAWAEWLERYDSKDIENTPCTKCGSTTTPLHTNGICGNCFCTGESSSCCSSSTSKELLIVCDKCAQVCSLINPEP